VRSRFFAEYRDDPNPAPDEPTALASASASVCTGRLVLRLLIVGGLGIFAVAALYLWARLFICGLWGRCLTAGSPGVRALLPVMRRSGFLPDPRVAALLVALVRL
jgi:hypothetical protein